MKKKKGLTFIELLAVISIIAILFVLLIPQIKSGVEKARISGVQTDFRSYMIAAQNYYMEKEEKKEEQEFNEYLDKPLKFENGKSKELNPWGEPYEYVQDGENFKIITKKSDVVAHTFEVSFNEEEKSFKYAFKGFTED